MEGRGRKGEGRRAGWGEIGRGGGEVTEGTPSGYGHMLQRCNKNVQSGWVITPCVLDSYGYNQVCLLDCPHIRM